MPRFWIDLIKSASRDATSSARLARFRWGSGGVKVLVKGIVRLCSLGELREPLSPMSEARSQGKHYTVKFVHGNKPRGVECLLCGLIGDLDYVKGKVCTPSPTATVSDGCAASEDPDMLASLAIVKSHEAEADRRMAEELQELQAVETELVQLHLLQQLDAEELLLQGLLNEQRALNLQAAKAADYRNRLSLLDPVNPSPEKARPENPAPENPAPENPNPENPTPENPQPENRSPENPSPENPTPENPLPENPSPRELFPNSPNPEPVVTDRILAKKPAISKLCGGSSDSVVLDTKPSVDLPYGSLDGMGWDAWFVSRICTYALLF